jgi:5-methylcytosine-specific restriction protein A
VASPYRAIQLDAVGSSRRVWIFPLKSSAIDAGSFVPVRVLEATGEAHRRRAYKLSDETLQARARSRGGNAPSRSVIAKVYVRDEYVAEVARRRAAGVCELRAAPAPFQAADGRPYLEIHHVTWLSKGGQDSPMNTVALCHNCHRKMHHIDDSEDRKKLVVTASSQESG